MKLYDYLQREKLTYEEMARHLSCTKTTLYRICKCNQIPKLQLAKLISEFTGGEVSVEELYEEKKNKPICPCCGHKLGKKHQPTAEDIRKREKWWTGK